jgi:RHS repeat-associated protein
LFCQHRVSHGGDDADNRTYMQRYHVTGQPADVYQYDGLYQLAQVWYGADATDPLSITSYAHLQGYDLDLLGNRLEVTHDGAGEVYAPNDGEQSTDPLNRYDTVGGNALRYDLRGNVLGDGVYTYTYDVLNRQTGVTDGVITTTYLYDARGRRVAKVTGGVTATHYVYDTQYRVIEERDDDEALLARYTYGTGMDEPLAMEQGGNTYYYHRDALGSVTEVTDGSGNLVERYAYDVYGAVTIFDSNGITLTASAIGNPYLFTTRRYDPESGNYYNRARMYSPWLGRFLSMDPLGFDTGDYNLYRYAFSNPINLTDPTGEFAFIPWLLSASAQAATYALVQAVFNLYIDPHITTAIEAVRSIDLRQVGLAFLSGLIPGNKWGRWVRSAAGAAGETTLFILDYQKECEGWPPLEAILRFFAGSLTVEIVGDLIGDAVAKYGTMATVKGLRKLGFDELAEKILRQLDELLQQRFDDFGAKVRLGKSGTEGIGQLTGSWREAKAYFEGFARPGTVKPHRRPEWAAIGGLEAEGPGGAPIFLRPDSSTGGPVIDLHQLKEAGRSIWKKVHFKP